MKSYYVMDSFLLKVYDLPDFLFKAKMSSMRSKALSLIPSNAERILDMASGTASIAIQAKKTFPGAEVHAIDLSDGMLKMAGEKMEKSNVKIILSKQNIEQTNFEDNYFDAVTIGFAMHHVTPEKTKSVFSEAKRVLKENGKLIIIDVHNSEHIIPKAALHTAITIVENHTKPFLKQDLTAELLNTGFATVNKNTHYFSLVQVLEAQKGQEGD